MADATMDDLFLRYPTAIPVAYWVVVIAVFIWVLRQFEKPSYTWRKHRGLAKVFIAKEFIH